MVLMQRPPQHCDVGADVLPGRSLAKNVCSFEVSKCLLGVGRDRPRCEFEFGIDGGTDVLGESRHHLTVVQPVVNYQGMDVSPLTRVGRALADPVRQRILVSLLEEPATPTSLVEQLGVSKTVLSNHLACLRGCGLVVGEAAGRAITYRLVSGHLEHALRDLLQLEAGLACAATELDHAALEPTAESAATAPSPRSRGKR